MKKYNLFIKYTLIFLILLIALILKSVSILVQNSNNPFIYINF
jgi:hypothetical protein